jgi:hypothetical protein
VYSSYFKALCKRTRSTFAILKFVSLTQSSILLKEKLEQKIWKNLESVLFRAKKKVQTKNKKIKKRDWLKSTTLLTENFRLVDVLLLLKKKLFWSFFSC